MSHTAIRVCTDCGNEAEVPMRFEVVGHIRRQCTPCQRRANLATGSRRADRNADVDDVVVQRLVRGVRVKANLPERLAATAILSGIYRYPQATIADRMHVSIRSVKRYQSELRNTA